MRIALASGAAIALGIGCTGGDSTDDTGATGTVFGQVLGSVSAVDPRRVAVIEERAYVCAGQQGLYHFDVTEPASPAWVETFFLGGECLDMLQLAGTIYAATGSGGFQVIDPEPLVVDGIYVPEDGAEVLSLGVDTTYDFAYLAEWDGSTARVERIDFTIPDVAKLEASHTVGTAMPRSLLENNEVVFVADSDGTVHTYDIGLTPTGSRPPTFVGTGDVDLAWDDDVLYTVLGDSGLVSVRVADPAYPTDLFVWDGDGRSIHAVTTTVDDRLYVALDGAIGIFDIHDPNEPALLGGQLVLVPGLERPLDITVAEGVAYVVDAAANTLTLIDVGEPDR